MYPLAASDRIEMLDVVRGFAVLGILLLNIILFGMHSKAFTNPGLDLVDGSVLDILVWAGNDLFAEGAMRALFSMLFGAGVVMLATGQPGKSGVFHYRRMALLFLIGLVDAYVLLWYGDILITYAVAGIILYLFRNLRPGWLFVWAGAIFLLFASDLGVGNSATRTDWKSAQVIAVSGDPESLSSEDKETTAYWEGVVEEFQPTPEAMAEEFLIRRESYASAFNWNAGVMSHLLSWFLPSYALWDALAMMLVGMAFLKLGILQGVQSRAFYAWLMVGGFVSGLAVNGYEVGRILSHNFDFLETVIIISPTYDIGRLAMACGYLGLLGLLVKTGVWSQARTRLAATGRMALTNYLMQSTICLFLFTGAGLGLVGEISRAGLYLFVLAIWILQLLVSPLWLQRFHYGPAEWLWRALSYGRMPPLRRQ